MSRYTSRLPILPTPGMDHPRWTRLRFHAADPANGTPGVAPAAPAPAAPAAPAAPVVDPGAAPAPTPAAPAPQPAPTGDLGAAEGQSLIDLIKADPEKAEKEIRRLRGESAESRTTRDAAAEAARIAVVQDIGKALGLVKDDATTDPAALTAAAQEATTKAREAQVELAVYKAAGIAETKADPAALLDSRAFLASVRDLDPSAADFQTKVNAAIKAAVEANPKLAAQEAAPTPPRRTAIDTGGTGERRGNAQPSSLTAAISAAYQQQ